MEWATLLKWLKSVSLSRLLSVVQKAARMWRSEKDQRRARADQDRLIRYVARSTGLVHAPASNIRVVTAMEGYLHRSRWPETEQILLDARTNIEEIVAFTQNCSPDFVRIGGQALLARYFDVLNGRLQAISRWLDWGPPKTPEDKYELSSALNDYWSLREDTIRLNADFAKLLEPYLQRRYRPTKTGNRNPRAREADA
jgi:hypothetical protein